MTTIWDVYECLNFISDKERNGYLSPEQGSIALDVAQNQLHAYYMPLTLKGDDLATAAMTPFQNRGTFNTNAFGALIYPQDWANTQAIYKSIGGQLVSFNNILHDELAPALRSVIYPITDNPRYLEEATFIQIYPQVRHTIELHYRTKPTTPVIGYTTVGNEAVYDPNTSVQLMFDTQYYMQIIQLACAYVGINLSSRDVQSAYSLFNQKTDGGAN